MKKLFKKSVSLLLSFSLILCSIFIFGTVTVLAEELKIERLKTENLKNPMGIDSSTPRFSWQMTDEETRGQYQIAYQIVVSNEAGNTVWDSGKVVSSESYNIAYEGQTLLPSTRYNWNVTVWDKDNISHISTEEAWFETGLMSNNDFINADWISTPNEVSTFGFSFNAKVRLQNGDQANILFGRNNNGYNQLLQWNAHPEGNDFFYWKVKRTASSIVLFLQRRTNGAEVNLASSIDLTANNYLEISTAASEGFDLRIDSDDGYINTYINAVLVSSLLLPDARIDGFTINQYSGCAAEYKNVRLTDESGCVNYDNSLADDSYFEGTIISDGWKRLEKGYYLPGGSSFTAEATIRFDASASTPVRTAEMLIGAKDVANYFIWQVKSSGNNILITPHYYRNRTIRATNQNPYYTFNIGEDVAANKTPITVKVVAINGTATTYINNHQVGTFYLGHIAVGSIGFRSFSKSSNVEFKDVKYTINGVTKTINDLFSAEELGEMNGDGYYKINGAYNVFTTLIGNSDATPGGAAPMLRKEFTVSNSKTVEKARLYATATGVYEAYINGQKVGDSYLNPGRTRYTDRIMYQTYDVTDLVQTGNNAIGVMIGRGWWRGGNTAYEGALTFAGKLLVKYTDGTEELLETGKDWSAFTDGHIRVNEIFNGEKIDNRKIPGSWYNAGYDETQYGWTTANTITASSLRLTNVVAQDGPLTKIYKTIEPISVNDVTTWYNSGANVKVYDFGQNIAGIVRIKVKGNAGDAITLRHAELVNGTNESGKTSTDKTDADGALWERGNRGAKQNDTFVLRGDSSGETFEASFVYHGFRYMQLGGELGDNGKQLSIPSGLQIVSVEALVLSSELEETGTFECSNEYINQYESNSRWSMIDNYLSIPTDCPQRDERYGWLSDAQVFTRTASYFMDINSFMSKFVTDCNDDFDTTTNMYPGATLQFNPKAAIGGWTDGAIVIPYRLYQIYGNKNAIIENYDNMKAYIDQTILDATRTNYTPVVGDTNSNNDIPGPTPAYIDMPASGESNNMYGDWFAYGEHTPYVITETAYIAYSTYLFSKMAEVIGNTTDAAYYAGEFENFRNAWNTEFVNSDGTMKCDPNIYGTGTFGTGRKNNYTNSVVNTQGAYVVGLALGMFADDIKDKAVEKLVDRIEADNYSIKTGFLGVSNILPVLTEEGYADVAYRMMEKTDFSSILWSVVNGATTTYEKWDAYTETDTTYTYTDHSLNHYSYGSATEWLYRYVLGIDTKTDTDTDVSAYKHIVLQPTVGGSLTYAKGSYNSVYGEIKSDWEMEDGEVTYKFVVPANTTATLYLPRLESGKTYYEGSVCATEADGVESVISDKQGKVAYRIGSGTYIFSVGSSDEQDYSKLAGKKIICIGSSTTAGDYGSNPAGTVNIQPRSYPYFLAQKTGAITKNMGNSGWSAKMTWENMVNGRRFLENVDWTDTDIVLIMLGNNSGLGGDFETDIVGDDYTQYNHDTQLGCYASIIKYAQEQTNNNARIVLMTHAIAPCKNQEVTSSIAETTRRIAERFGLDVIDNYTSCGITYNNYQEYMPVDGQHCNEAGYELMAEYIADQLLQYCSDFDAEENVGIPELYKIGGKNTVFVSNLDHGKYAKVRYNGSDYYAYSTLNNAIAALGKDGGVIRICGTFDEKPDYNTGTMALIDYANRSHILVEGAGSNAVWDIISNITWKSDTTFRNLTIRQTTNNNGFMFNVSGNTVFESDCVVNASKWLFLTCGTNTVLNGNKFTSVDFLGPAQNPQNVEVTLNYEDPDDYPNLNGGYSGTARAFTGGAAFIVTGTGIGAYPTASASTGRNLPINKVTNTAGTFSLIFNNGSYRTKDPDDTSDSKTSHYNYTIDSKFDYVVYSSTGGEVTVKEYGNKSQNIAPTYKLVPSSENLVPYVGGVAVEKTGGEYLYTPEISDTQTAVSVSYIDNSTTKKYPLTYKNLAGQSYGFMGRWYDRTVDETACKATMTAGSELYFKVQNTENVALSLKSQAAQPPTIAVSVDNGEPIRVFTVKDGNTMIAQGLDKTKSHTIRVIVDGFYEYQTNKWATGDGFVFEKAVVDDGGAVSGIYPENKVILYFGDSVTEGIHAIAKGSNPYGNSHIGTYAFTNSSLLGMVSYTSGYGGTGVTRAGSGSVPKTIDVINHLYGGDSSLPDYPDEADVAAIVINYGANDYNAGATSEQFKTAYTEVVNRIEELYPNTPIVALVNVRGVMKDEVEEVATQMSNSGTDIRSIHVGAGSGANMNYESLDWAHPTAAGGKFLGTRLATEMREIVGAPPEPWDGSVAASLSGAGTADNPYLIGNGAELKYFANEISAGRKSTNHFKLTADIYLNDISDYSNWNDSDAADELNKWSSIGYYTAWNDCKIFQGTFDGDGHTIYGMYVNEQTNNKGTGLFGGIGYYATIANLTVSKAYVIGNGRVGGIAGASVGDVNIVNTHFDGVITTADEMHSNTNIWGTTPFSGGIIGLVDGTGTINVNSCSTNGELLMQYISGGFFGSVQNNATININNSYSAMDIGYNNYILVRVGGFIGRLNNASAVVNIRKSHFAGTVRGSNSSDNCGAIVGQLNSVTVNASSTYFNSNLISVPNPTAISSGVTALNNLSFMDGTVSGYLNNVDADYNTDLLNWEQGESYPIFKLIFLGDCNDDNLMDIRDLIRLKRHIAKLDVSMNKRNADLVLDNEINALDLVMLTNRLLNE